VNRSEINIVRSRRARRISLSVKRDGSVRLTLPWWCGAEEGLRFAADRTEWIERARQKQLARGALPVRSAEEIERLRRRAKELLPAALEAASRRTGLRYNRLTVRDTRSRWGSCSAENNISLSIYLTELPEHLVDYIAVHELCHTVHRNHSAAFHALVDSFVGGREKELQRELRKYTPR